MGDSSVTGAKLKETRPRDMLLKPGVLLRGLDRNVSADGS
jgi:hypothetical protein